MPAKLGQPYNLPGLPPKSRMQRSSWGRMYEGEATPAFGPWKTAIRAYMHDTDPQLCMGQLGPGAADIAEIMPILKHTFPHLEPAPQLPSNEARARLHDSMTDFLRAISKNYPLFMTLVIHDMKEHRQETLHTGRLPEGIVEAIDRRLSRLSQKCKNLLSQASVIGRSFDLKLLAKIAGENEDRVLANSNSMQEELVVLVL